MVNRISDQVELAATYVQQGGIELQKAVVYKQNSRKVRLLVTVSHIDVQIVVLLK